MDAKKAWVFECGSSLTTRRGVWGACSIEGKGYAWVGRGSWAAGRQGRGKQGVNEHGVFKVSTDA